MTQKLFYLSVASALLFCIATANIAQAEEATAPVASEACQCALCQPPCCQSPCFNPCYPTVSYRVGLFGAIRPVVYAPAYRPARFICPPYVPYRPACPPYYCW